MQKTFGCVTSMPTVTQLKHYSARWIRTGCWGGMTKCWMGRFEAREIAITTSRYFCAKSV